jgi:hypothetical protein
MKSPKELYNYIWIIQLVIILFLILGIVMMYNNNIHIFYNLVIILLFIIVVFIQNNLILAELESPKEGLSNYDCFKLYSKYATNQYKTDIYDASLNKLINQMKLDISGNTGALQTFSTNLKTKLNTILGIISDNIKSVVEKANAWNGQYTTTLKGMNNMMNTLYDIRTNLESPTPTTTDYNFTVG